MYDKVKNSLYLLQTMNTNILESKERIYFLIR